MAGSRIELIIITDKPHPFTNEKLAIQAAVNFYSDQISEKEKRELVGFFRSMPRGARKDLIKALHDAGMWLYRRGFDEHATEYLTAHAWFQEDFMPPAKMEWPYPIENGKGSNERNYLLRSDPRRKNFKVLR